MIKESKADISKIDICNIIYTEKKSPKSLICLGVPLFISPIEEQLCNRKDRQNNHKILLSFKIFILITLIYNIFYF